HRADLRRLGATDEVRRRAPEVLLGLGDVEGHEELPRRVGLTRRLPVEQVRGERGEALGGQPVRHALDVGHEPPPFLDDEDAGAGARGGDGEVRGTGSSVGRELYQGARHGRDLLWDRWEPDAPQRPPGVSAGADGGSGAWAFTLTFRMRRSSASTTD